MDIDEQRIKYFAYQIWQSEGEPEGQEERHWEMARKLAEAESSAPPVHTEESFPDTKPATNDTGSGESDIGESGDGNAGSGDSGIGSLDSKDPASRL